MKIRHHIERVEFAEGLVLLQGWVVHDEKTTVLLQLNGKDLQGNPWSRPVAFNRDRPDVVEALGLSPSLLHCGFFYYAAVPVGTVLELSADSDGVCSVLHRWNDGYIASDEQPVVSPGSQRLRAYWQTWRYFGGRSWALLRKGQWKGFKARAQRHLSIVLQIPRLRLDSSAHILKSATFRWDCLVIDHDLGGGANQYRTKQLMSELFTENSINVALLTFSVLSLQYVVFRISPDGARDLVVRGSWSQVLSWLQQVQIKHVFYNNAVSFPHAFALVQALRAYRDAQSCRLTLAVHDYFAVCPSQHLQQTDGRYCAIPSLGECSRCIAQNEQAMLSLYRHHGIENWRFAWGELLASADEVRIFDASAENILRKAYPQILFQTILRPHQVAKLTSEECGQLLQWRMRKNQLSVRIGVVGAITSCSKGAIAVASLAQAIARSGRSYQIIVIGEYAGSSNKNLHVTGSYRPAELTPLIIKNDIDMFFFSSIVPETFSYVLHELERYQLPIAAFNIGAQSTFLERYSKAISLNLTDSSDEILKKIELFLESVAR